MFFLFSRHLHIRNEWLHFYILVQNKELKLFHSFSKVLHKKWQRLFPVGIAMSVSNIETIFSDWQCLPISFCNRITKIYKQFYFNSGCVCFHHLLQSPFLSLCKICHCQVLPSNNWINMKTLNTRMQTYEKSNIHTTYAVRIHWFTTVFNYFLLMAYQKKKTNIDSKFMLLHWINCVIWDWVGNMLGVIVVQPEKLWVLF